MLEEAMSTGDVARRRKLLDALVQENPENADVQLAQAILGGLYSQGKGGATRNLERAAQLLENPARHGHPQALLQLTCGKKSGKTRTPAAPPRWRWRCTTSMS